MVVQVSQRSFQFELLYFSEGQIAFGLCLRMGAGGKAGGRRLDGDKAQDARQSVKILDEAFKTRDKTLH